VVNVRALRRPAHAARAGRDAIEQDFAFVEIKQQISCGITMIMLRAAVPPRGKPG
jgi:hypothetical protein